MNDRLKKLRKALDLTQQEFADRIGSKRNTVATYEIGRNEPSSAVISLICREFDVNESWLRTGEGEMFLPKPTAALDALAVEHSLSNSDYILVEKFLALKPETRKAMMDYMKEVVAAISSMEVDGSLADAPAFPSSLSHGIPCTMEEVDEQANVFRNGLIMDIQHRQRQEPDTRPREEKPVTEWTEADIDADVEEYRQSLLEEKRRAGSGSVSGGPSSSDTV